MYEYTTHTSINAIGIVITLYANNITEPLKGVCVCVCVMFVRTNVCTVRTEMEITVRWKIYRCSILFFPVSDLYMRSNRQVHSA